MPQSPLQRITNTFNKGLLTEFSELNFPENASIDELNCDLLKAGNRTRRLGLQYEDSFSLSDETYTATDSLDVVGEWTNVGGDPSVDFYVIKAGFRLIFYERGASVSNNAVTETFASSTTYRISLQDFFIPSSGVDLSSSIVEVTSINGVLVVVGRGLEPFYVERDLDTGVFTETQIEFKVRDFQWQTNPIEDLFNQDAAPDKFRKYDTINAGWTNITSGNSPLDDYETANSAYPPLVLPWFSGKDSNGDFDVTEWEKIGAGNTLQANGHVILDLFNKDRTAETGVINIEVEATTQRFSTTETYAGRIFYGGIGSRVYFTRIIENKYEFGLLYQVNDPTSEDFNDLLDTDGGWIDIPEAVNVKKLHMFGSSLLVFAENGVWRITGVDGVFRASEYSVYRVSDLGISSKRSFVAGENSAPFWWSFAGIMTIQVTEEGGMKEVNLSRSTIQTFWSSIDNPAKTYVKGVFDPLNGRVSWLYPENDAANPRKVNRLLILDTEIGAFFPWKISDKSSDTPIVTDAVNIEGFVEITEEFNVVDSNGNSLIDNSLNTVISDIDTSQQASSNLKYLTIDSDGYITFSEFSSPSFYDWDDANYESYAEAGYDFLGDIGRRKNATYITVACRTSETAFEASGQTYVFDRPSSVLVSCYWDFKRIPSVSQQQGYRILRPVVVNAADLTYTSERTVNINRLKLRGRGRVMRLKFESEEGKDFNLLGWEVLGGTNPRY